MSLAALTQRLVRWNMVGSSEQLPAQIESALEQEVPSPNGGPFNEVVLVGMGGSGTPMDIVRDIFREQLRVPVTVVREYDLVSAKPQSKRLLILSSLSGSTEEVLAAFEGVNLATAGVVVMTGGGRLLKAAAAKGVPTINIPACPPRATVGYTVPFLARLLFQAGVMTDPRPELEGLVAFLRQATSKDEAIETAEWLGHSIPVIYSDERHVLSVGQTTQIKFNENSKRAAFYNALPEANHNEMVGFTEAVGQFGILYFDDPTAHPRIRRRYAAMQQVFAARGLSHVRFRRWEMAGESPAQRTFSSLSFADWCSHALALYSGYDPTTIELVDEFKQVLEGPAAKESRRAA